MGKQYIWNIYTKMQYIYIVSGIYRVKKKKKDINIYLYIKKQYICNIYTKMQYIYIVSGIYFVKKKKQKKDSNIYDIYIN
jgi:hypothetical protein